MSVVYGFANGIATTQNSNVDAGFGYRFLTSPNLMLGINASFGMGWSDDNNSAWRGAVGLEAKSLNWDFLLTGYISEKKDQKRKGGQGRDSSQDGTIVFPTPNTIGMLIGIGGEKWERGAPGFEAEMGYTFGLNQTRSSELRVYAGGYGYFPSKNIDKNFDGTPFEHDGKNYDTIWGGKGGVEVRFSDLSSSMPGMSISLRGEGRYDKQENFDAFASARVAFALGSRKSGGAMDASRRLSDPVHRDRMFFAERSVGASIEVENVFATLDASQSIIQSVQFASTTGAGTAGTNAAPTTIEQAITNAGGQAAIPHVHLECGPGVGRAGVADGGNRGGECDGGGEQTAHGKPPRSLAL